VLLNQPRRVNDTIHAGRTGARGFSLVEVLVALIIIAVGMLGLAKIQALAYASTGTASLRSLAAIEASSLAAAMRANRNYWSTTATPLNISFVGTVITVNSGDAGLTAAFNCKKPGADAPCTVGHLAAFDLQQWVGDVNAVLPLVTGVLDCPKPVTGPTGCTISLTWNESSVAANAAAAAAAAGSPLPFRQYTLYVEP
jgi:type IV pilus assembly protein PilV